MQPVPEITPVDAYANQLVTFMEELDLEHIEVPDEFSGAYLESLKRFGTRFTVHLPEMPGLKCYSSHVSFYGDQG